MFIGAVPGNIGPKSTGYFVTGGTDMCLGAPPGQNGDVVPVGYRRFVIELPNGEGSISTSYMPPCGPLGVSQVGTTPPSAVELVPAPGTLPYLQATLQLPARIFGGRVLHYVIVLSNPGSTPVPLKPCPGYSEWLTLVAGAKVNVHTWSFMLNCTGTGAIRGDKAVSFAMEMTVPSVSRTEIAKFSWQLETANGPFRGTVVNVFS
jgi:hypothetical protein